MGRSSKINRHKVWYYLLALVVLIGLAVLSIAVGDQVRLRRWRKDIHSHDTAVRCKALYKVGKEREYRTIDDVLSALADEQDRTALERAGYAAMRLGDERGIALLQSRADEGPDDSVCARLMFFAARLSRRFDLRLVDWMSGGIKSPETWRRAGSVLGLTELGDPEGGVLLIEYGRVAKPEVGKFLLDEFQRIADAMAEAIGQTIDWPSNAVGPVDEKYWTGLRTFWERYATEKLLNDVLARLEIRDPKWYEVNRLLHARDRIACWLDL